MKSDVVLLCKKKQKLYNAPEKQAMILTGPSNRSAKKRWYGKSTRQEINMYPVADPDVFPWVPRNPPRASNKIYIKKKRKSVLQWIFIETLWNTLDNLIHISLHLLQYGRYRFLLNTQTTLWDSVRLKRKMWNQNGTPFWKILDPPLISGFLTESVQGNTKSFWSYIKKTKSSDQVGIPDLNINGQLTSDPHLNDHFWGVFTKEDNSQTSLPKYALLQSPFKE